MGFTLAFAFVASSIICTAQNEVIPGTIKVVHDKPTYGFSSPVCGVNSDGKAVIMWGRRSNQHVFVAVENGTGFDAPLRLNPVGMTVFAQDWAGPDMSIAGKNVHVVVKSQPEKSGHVYLISSKDGGKTFGDTNRVSNNTWSRFPAVGVSPDGKKVHVAYMAFDSGFLDPHYVVCSSMDGGKTFGEEVKASLAPGEVCDCCPADVYVDDKRLMVLFRNNDNDLRDMWAAVSLNNGQSFELVKDIDYTDWYIGACPASGPTGFIGGDSLYSVWMNASSGRGRIYLGTASNIGLNVGRNIKISPSLQAETSQNYPIISGLNNQMGIIWQENLFGKGSVKFVYSGDGSYGVDEKNILKIDEASTGIPENLFVFFDGTTFHTVWQNNQKHSILYRSLAVNPLSAGHKFNATILDLYPNPANSFVEFRSRLNGSLFIYESNGELISTTLISSGINQIDISMLSSGMYYIHEKTSRGTRSGKLIIAPE